NVEFAKRIETYINDEMKPMKSGTIASFEYFEISSATGVEISTVRSLLQPIDSGSHGITISR
ncbi:MAG: hypothetical protein PF795_04060, partial [Kiritimatiellae bacterium]|nr:hypothetical protein [Kiritimatiellia bacterium]